MKKRFISWIIVLFVFVALSYQVLSAEEDLTGQEADCITYYAISCTSDGDAYDCSKEYMVLNPDGSGLLVEEGCAYTVTWYYEDPDFSLIDSKGNEMTGTVDEDYNLNVSYYGYDYVFQPGDNAPITQLSPDSWGAGLPYVTDQADILTDDEEASLTARAKDISETYKCNVYIVTLDDMNNYTFSYNIETCAEEIRSGYSLGYGAGQDCMMLVLSMAERDYDMCAYGDFGNASFTDYGKETLGNLFLDDFKNNNWNAGFEDYMDGCEQRLEMSASGTPLDVGTVPVNKGLSVVISLVLALIISLIVSFVLKLKMKPVKENVRAGTYVAQNGVHITRRQDQYKYTSTSRVYDPPSKSSGGGTSTSSSGHSHSSGKF